MKPAGEAAILSFGKERKGEAMMCQIRLIMKVLMGFKNGG